jgi:hypothetical protein
MGWKTEWSELKSQQDKKFSIVYIVYTGFVVHPAYCPTGAGGSFFRSKAARAQNWPLNWSYCQDEENVVLYVSFTMRLRGIVLS